MKIIFLFLIQIVLVLSEIPKYVELNPRHYCERRISLFTSNVAKQVVADSRAICPFSYGDINNPQRSYKIRRIYYLLTTGGRTDLPSIPYSQSTYLPTIGIKYVKHPYPEPVDPNEETQLYLGQIFTSRFLLFQDVAGGNPNEYDDTDIIVKNANLNDSSLATSWEQFTKESQDLGSGDYVHNIGVKLLKEFKVASVSNIFEVTAREVAKDLNATMHGIRPERLAPQNVRITSAIDQITDVGTSTGMAFEYFIVSYGNVSDAKNTGDSIDETKFMDYPNYSNENQTSYSMKEPKSTENAQGGFFSVRNLIRAYDIQGTPLLFRGIVRKDVVNTAGLGIAVDPAYNVTRVVVSFAFQGKEPYRVEFESSFGVDEFYISSSAKMTLTLLGVLFSVIAYVF
eukprot:gene4344-7700_t